MDNCFWYNCYKYVPLIIILFLNVFLIKNKKICIFSSIYWRFELSICKCFRHYLRNLMSVCAQPILARFQQVVSNHYLHIRFHCVHYLCYFIMHLFSAGNRLITFSSGYSSLCLCLFCSRQIKSNATNRQTSVAPKPWRNVVLAACSNLNPNCNREIVQNSNIL